MKGKRFLKSYFSYIACFAILFFICASGIAEDAPKAVTEAARSGLLPFLEKMPAGEEEYYGFNSGENPEQSSLGEPFLLYTITPEALFNYRDGETVSSLLTSTQVWLFPVVLGGDYRAMLTVARQEGVWKAVAFGKAALARELQKIHQQWPDSKGYEPKLVAVFQATAYFFTLPAEDDQNLTPLFFEGKGFAPEFYRSDEGYRSTVKISQIIGQLRETVEENLKSQDF